MQLTFSNSSNSENLESKYQPHLVQNTNQMGLIFRKWAEILKLWTVEPNDLEYKIQ